MYLQKNRNGLSKNDQDHNFKNTLKTFDQLCPACRPHAAQSNILYSPVYVFAVTYYYVQTDNLSLL